MNPIISVIVPTFNREALLSLCIESILGQTFRDLELIVVDDGSTDGTADLCRDFEREDERMKYIYKSNGGVSQALKKGIENAQGKWIAFCDSDDTMPHDALAKLYQQTNPNTDLIVGFSFPGDGSRRVLSIDSWREQMIASDVILCTRWAKLYRRSIMDSETVEVQPAIKVGEDMVMNIKAAFKTDNGVTILQDYVYNYRRNVSSITVQFERNISWCYGVYTAVNDILLEHGSKDRYAASLIRNGLEMMKKLVIKGSWSEQKKLRNSSFVQTLQSDISDAKFVPTRKEQLMLKHPASYLVRLYFQSSRAAEIVRGSLKKRFGH